MNNTHLTCRNGTSVLANQEIRFNLPIKKRKNFIQMYLHMDTHIKIKNKLYLLKVITFSTLLQFTLLKYLIFLH